MIENFYYPKAELDKVLKSIGFLVDSREKSNDNIIQWLEKKKIPYKVQKLEYGDYSFYIPKDDNFNIPRDLHFSNEIVFERKGSVDELAGNFADSRDRIEKEFSLCPAKIHLIVEGTYKDISDGNYRSNYGRNACVGTLHSFQNRYDISMFFNPHKELTAQIMYYTFYYYLRNKLK